MSSQENERLQSLIKKQKTEMAKLQATCEEQVRDMVLWVCSASRVCVFVCAGITFE